MFEIGTLYFNIFSIIITPLVQYKIKSRRRKEQVCLLI